MRAPLVLAAVAALMLIPTIAVFSAESSAGSPAMGDSAGTENPTDVDNSVLCLSGSGQTRMAVGPGDTIRSVAASVTWLIVADGTVTYTLDGGAPRSLTVSGAASLQETLARGEAHAAKFVMPDGSMQSFQLRVSSSAYYWDENGEEDGGAWRTDRWLDDRDRQLVLLSTAAALLTCGLVIAYHLMRKSDSVEDIL